DANEQRAPRPIGLLVAGPGAGRAAAGGQEQQGEFARPRAALRAPVQVFGRVLHDYPVRVGQGGATHQWPGPSVACTAPTHPRPGAMLLETPIFKRTSL